MGRQLRFSSEAVAQVYSFLVAGFIFVVSAGGILVWSQFAGEDPALGEQAAQEADAEALATLLLGSPGQGWATPDALIRPGLGAAAGTLDGTHVALLNGDSLPAAANGLLDYEEAHAAFGLGPDAGFNLRITPLQAEALLEGHDFDYVHALYIGDWASLGTVTLSPQNATIQRANAELNLTMAAATLWERQVLQDVGVEFDDEVHLTTNTPTILVQVSTSPNVRVPLLTHLSLPLWNGDVLYDNKQYLDSVIPGKLGTGGYDLLVIGAGIDHSTLTSNAVKGAIEAFVRSGGTLMVFGSSGGNYNWMQPLFDVSAASVTGPVTAADPQHDVLGRPWDLKWAQYDTQGLAWDIGDIDSFEVVLQQGGRAVLAISEPGAVDDGTVFLTSYKSSTIGAALGSAEAQHLLFNMLLYLDQTLVPDLDTTFGPPAPADRPVSSAVRTMNLDDPGFGLVPVRVELTAWGTR